MENIVKLSAMPYAQAFVYRNAEYATVLRSYQTDVAYIDSYGWLVVNGLYSMTTRKHIGAFVKEYAKISFQLAKKFYEDGMKYNIFTGEVCPI
jgi:hypothetical protein